MTDNRKDLNKIAAWLAERIDTACGHQPEDDIPGVGNLRNVMIEGAILSLEFEDRWTVKIELSQAKR